MIIPQIIEWIKAGEKRKVSETYKTHATRRNRKLTLYILLLFTTG